MMRNKPVPNPELSPLPLLSKHFENGPIKGKKIVLKNILAAPCEYFYSLNSPCILV